MIGEPKNNLKKANGSCFNDTAATFNFNIRFITCLSEKIKL